MDLLDEELLFIGNDDGNDADDFDREVEAALQKRAGTSGAVAGGSGSKASPHRSRQAPGGRQGTSRSRPSSAQRPGSAARSREHPTHATMAAIYGAKASPGGGRGKRGGGKQTQTRRRRSRPRSALPRESAPTVHHSGRSTLMVSREAPHSGGRPASAKVRSREVTTTEEEARRGNLAHLRGIHGQIRAATGLFAGNASGRGERPASSRSAKPGHGRRPVSATARGAAGTYKLDMSAPAIGPRRARPWSAIAPRTSSSIRHPHSVADHQRRSIKKGNKKGTFSSAAELRRAAAKRRAEQEAFANALLAEEREQLQAAHARVTQANVWASSLGTGRNYRTTRVHRGGKAEESEDLETRVVVHEPDGSIRDISLEIFDREYKKLHQQVRRVAVLNANGNNAPGSPTKAANRPPSPVRTKQASGDAWPSALSPLQKRGKQAAAPIGHYTHTLTGAMARRKRRPNKQEVQSELRAVLKETAQLTQVLEQQLAELRAKGWNDLGDNAGNKSHGHGTSGFGTRRKHSNDDLLVYTKR